jgi:hypothetical protein
MRISVPHGFGKIEITSSQAVPNGAFIIGNKDLHGPQPQRYYAYDGHGAERMFDDFGAALDWVREGSHAVEPQATSPLLRQVPEREGLSPDVQDVPRRHQEVGSD